MCNKALTLHLHHQCKENCDKARVKPTAPTDLMRPGEDSPSFWNRYCQDGKPFFQKIFLHLMFRCCGKQSAVKYFAEIWLL